MRRLALGLTVFAVAGCGGSAAVAQSSGPAPDPGRTRDLVLLTTKQAVRAADRIAVVVARGSRVVEGAPGTPFTRTRFEVQDVLASCPASSSSRSSAAGWATWW